MSTLIDVEFPVLDHGKVVLVDVMGDDARIAQTARHSYKNDTKKIRADAKLIEFLIKEGHTSPLENVVFQFYVKCPIFVARQWHRHRTARINELSGRYSKMEQLYYIPASGDLGGNSKSRRQGRDSEALGEMTRVMTLAEMRKSNESSYRSYDRMIEDGIARELARTVLPLSAYTEMYWQMDLNNLFNFLRLRLGEHAQFEIRAYAQVIDRIVADHCPIAHAAFVEHVLTSRKFSGTQYEMLVNFAKSDDLYGIKKMLGIEV